MSPLDFSSSSEEDDASTAPEVVVIVNSDSDSSELLRDPSLAASQTYNITSHLSIENLPSSPEWRTDVNLIDDKCLHHSIWCSVQSLNYNRLNAQGYTKINPMTGENDYLSLNVSPCGDDDVITLRISGADGSP